MRRVTAKLICVLLLPFLLAGCVSIFGHTVTGETSPTDESTGTTAGTTAPQTTLTEPPTQTTEPEVPKPVFLHAKQAEETGVPKTIAVHTENFAYGVHYPAIGNDAVDLLIEAQAMGIAEDFAKRVDGYFAEVPENRAILQADYKTYLTTDAAGTYKLLSVVFELYPDIHTGAKGSGTIRTAFFDLTTGKSLTAADVFGRNYLDVVSKKTTEHFTAHPMFAQHVKTTLFTDGTSAKAENFSKFAFVQGQAIFYFDRAGILPEKFGCPSVSMPITELYKVIKVKVTDRAPFRMFDAKEKMIVLTYDDGPKTPNTDRILDALEKVGGRASFFVLGLMIDKNEAVMKRAYLMGCDIDNHSYNHKKMEMAMSDSDIKYQLDECEKRIIRVTGEPSAFFRMPYGFNNKNADGIINKPIIAWSLDTVDWVYSDTNKKNRNRTPEQRQEDKQKIIARMLDKVKDGDILLMHDIHEFTVELSEELIPALAARGFQLVTLNELFEARGVKPENGEHYRQVRPQ